MRSLWRTCSLLAGGLLAFACGDPDLKTDLDTEGPPEVNMVTVTNEGAPIAVNGNAFPETPMFCRSDGGRINTSICPEDQRVGDIAVDSATPIGVRVRVVFSELLDPSIEALEDRDGDMITEGHLDTTNPVSLSCGGTDIAYDGFYDPSGNDVTVPPGPALVISPTDLFPVATGTSCEVTINSNVTDKDGNALPASFQGPFSYTVAPLSLAATDPADGSEGVEPAGAIMALAFNAPLDMGSVAAGDVTLTDANGPVNIQLGVFQGDPTILLVIPTAGNLDGDTTYTLTLKADATLKDVLGGPLSNPSDVVVTFTTGPGGGADAGVDAS